MRPGQGRPQRDSQNVGDFAKRQLRVVAEQNDLALRVGKPRHGARQPLALLPIDKPLLGISRATGVLPRAAGLVNVPVATTLLVRVSNTS